MVQQQKANHSAPETSLGRGGSSGSDSSHERGREHGATRGSRATTMRARLDDERYLAKHGDQLSKTTLRSKWIHTAVEHEDHAGQSLATRCHEVIQHWAEDRGGQPTTIPGTGHGDRPGVLRFNFPGYGGLGLEPISWDDWFRTFDERELVFVFQEHKSDGHMSNFFQLDSPYREDA